MTNPKEPSCALVISTVDLVFSMAVGGGDGKKHALLAVSCKDGMLRVYDLADGGKALYQSRSHAGSKASRIFWISDSVVCTIGFSKSNQREIRLYDISKDDEAPLPCLIDTNPSLLEAYYDPDTQLVFLCGRGDSFIHLAEVNAGDLVCNLLSKIELPGIQQGAFFLPKVVSNI